MTVRLIQPGEEISASKQNRPHNDILTGAGYNADGSDYLGFAQMVHGRPRVASAVARDLFFPAPQHNQRVERDDTGVVERYDQPSGTWRPEGVTRAAGPVIAAKAKGAHGDGNLDDQAFLAQVDAAVATTGRAELDPGIYVVNSDLTLNADWHFARGAVLRPAAGVTITILGHPRAGAYAWMDWSLGGMFNTRGNKAIHEWLVVWFGVVGDNVVDDRVNWMNAVNAVEDYTTFLATPQLISRLASELRIENRAGIHVRSNQIPFPNGVSPCPQFAWDGPQGFVAKDGSIALNSRTFNSASGGFVAGMEGESFWAVGCGPFGLALRTTIATVVNWNQVILSNKAQTGQSGIEFHAGGVMIFLDRCVNCKFSGFAIWADQNQFIPNRASALVIFDIDGYTNQTELLDKYESCLNLTVQGSTTLVTSTGGLFRPGQFNQILNVPGAGGGGGALQGSVKRVISTTQLVLGAVAASNFTGVTGTVSGTYGFGSASSIEWCQLGRFKGHKDFVAVSLSTTSQNNQEYNYLCHVVIQGNGNRSLVIGAASINSGTNALTVNASIPLDSSYQGRRVRIKDGGGLVGGLSTCLDTPILSVTDASHATLTALAGATIVAGDIIVGEGLGIGVKNGSSFNAKRQVIDFCNFSALRAGISLLAGSIVSMTNNFNFNEIDHEYLGSSEPCTIYHSNSEASGQHLVTSMPDAVTLIGCRMAPLWGKPNGGYIEPFAGSPVQSSGPVTLIGCLFDQSPEPGNAIFDLGGQGGFTGALAIRNTRFNFITESQLFRRYGSPGSYKIIREGLANINGANPFLHLQGVADLVVEGSGINVAGGFMTNAAITGRNRPINGNHDAYGVLGQADTDAAGGNRVVGVRGEAGTLSTRTQFTSEFVGVEGVGPIIDGDPTVLATALSAQPSIVHSGALTTMRGLVIYPMKTSGVTFGQGIQQQGGNDTNLLAGLTKHAAGMVEGASVYIDIAAGGNATPNPAGMKMVRYRMAGAASVNKPINLQKGIVLTLVMFNNTAGPITPALDPSFLGSGFGPIGAGKSRSRRYVYDDVRDALEPVGAVSEDF
jgi:hypothetical protein